MYCAHCGTNIPDSSPVCPSCSTPTISANYDDALNRALERHRKLERISQQADNAREAAILAEEEHRRLSWRFKSCSVITLILAVAFTAFVFYAGTLSIDYYEYYESSFAPYGISIACYNLILLGILILCFLMSIIALGALVFGIPPTIDFIRRHGFSIWGSLIVLLAAGALVLAVAYAVGFGYPFHLISKISLTKKEAAALKEEAARLERAAAAC